MAKRQKRQQRLWSWRDKTLEIRVAKAAGTGGAKMSDKRETQKNSREFHGGIGKEEVKLSFTEAMTIYKESTKNLQTNYYK